MEPNTAQPPTPVTPLLDQTTPAQTITPQPVQTTTPEPPRMALNPRPKWPFILLGLILIVILIGGAFVLGKSLNVPQKPASKTAQVLSPTSTPAPIPVSIATNSGALTSTDTASWKKYTNTKYKFSFKYPPAFSGLGSIIDPMGNNVSLIQESYGGQPKMEVYISTGSAAMTDQSFLNQIVSTGKGLENFKYSRISSKNLDNQTLYFYSEDFDSSSNGLPSPGQPLNTFVVSNTIKDVFYNISYHYLPDKSEQENALYNQILSTFKFTP